MKSKLFLLGILLLLLSADAFALQKLFLYVSLGYGRGWWGWACVNEMGLKGVYGSPVNYCGARDCPFDAAASCGENNCVSAVNDNILYMAEQTFMEFGAITWITVPENMKLVKEDGTVVGDQLCVGDRFTFEKGVEKGEYWNDGGNMDTPSIYWVDDVEALTKKILDYHEKNKLTCKDVRADGPVQDTTDTLTGIPVVKNPKTMLYSGGDITGRLVCSLKEKSLGSTGVEKKGNSYVATGSGNIEFNASYSVECMFYYYGGRGRCAPTMDSSDPMDSRPVQYVIIRMPMVLQARTLEPGENTVRVVYRMGNKGNVVNAPAMSPNDPIYLYCNEVHNIVFNSMEDFFKIGEIKLEKTLKVIDPAKASADLTVYASDDLKYGADSIVRVVVKNSGDTDISITKVYASVSNKLISCDSVSVKPGSESECLISVIPVSGQGMIVSVDYEYKSCGSTKTGTASKVVIESVSVTPAASAQVYSIDVRGGCENQYYGCYAPDKDGKFAAGYECYNTGDQYYSPVKERFNLRFVLPDLTSKTVLGASLNLFATNVNRAQEVKVFSGKVDWTPTSCSASGDICVRPYCEECAPSFDFAGGAERAAQTIGGGGKVSFDLSDLVKEAYSGGLSALDLQVRGEEDVWASAGIDSCSRKDEWIKQDAEFQGSGANKPYLEIVYK